MSERRQEVREVKQRTEGEIKFCKEDLTGLTSRQKLEPSETGLISRQRLEPSAD